MNDESMCNVMITLEELEDLKKQVSDRTGIIYKLNQQIEVL